MDGQDLLVRKINELYLSSQVTNPRFSLRALAAKLDIPVSTLSELRNGKRKFSQKLLSKISHRLILSPEEKRKILANVTTEKENKTTRGLRQNRYEILPQDQFSVIGDWVHFAILSLFRTDDFNDSPEWMAKRLGVSSKKVIDCLRRLERLKILTRTAQGRLKRTEKDLSTSSDVRDLAIQKAHHENLELAQKSLHRVAIENRELDMITMAINPSKLPEAKRRIREFRDELSEDLSEGPKNEVYRLSIQLFPLTAGEKNV